MPGSAVLAAQGGVTAAAFEAVTGSFGRAAAALEAVTPSCGGAAAAFEAMTAFCGGAAAAFEAVTASWLLLPSLGSFPEAHAGSAAADPGAAEVAWRVAPRLLQGASSAGAAAEDADDDAAGTGASVGAFGGGGVDCRLFHGAGASSLPFAAEVLLERNCCKSCLCCSVAAFGTSGVEVGCTAGAVCAGVAAGIDAFDAASAGTACAPGVNRLVAFDEACACCVAGAGCVAAGTGADFEIGMPGIEGAKAPTLAGAAAAAVGCGISPGVTGPGAFARLELFPLAAPRVAALLNATGAGAVATLFVAGAVAAGAAGAGDVELALAFARADATAPGSTAALAGNAATWVPEAPAAAA